jgi:hypothetical protein
MVGDRLGSGVGVSVLGAVSVFGTVAVGATVVACPQAEMTNDRNTSTNISFFITWILIKTGNLYHTAFIPAGRESSLLSMEILIKIFGIPIKRCRKLIAMG